MSESNKKLAIDFLEALCRGDIEFMKPRMTADIEAVAVGTGAISGTRNYNAIVETAGAFPSVMPTGLNPVIDTVTTEGDRVAIEWRGNCTLSNGEAYNNNYAMIFTLHDGKVSRIKEYFCTKLADEVLVPLLYQQVAPPA